MKKIIIIYFLIIITSVFGFKSANATTTNTYKIDISIDTLQRTINGSSEITVFNNSNEKLDKLYFLLGLNNSYDTRMKVTEVSSENDVILPGNFYVYRYLEKDREEKSIFQVSLPSELNPSDSIKLKFKFEISNLTKINNILFLDDSIFDIYTGSWYPRLINYENGVWKKRDFISNNYEVNLTVAEDETVVSTAIELSSEIIKLKGLKKISYQINNSRNFSVIISKKFSNDTEELKNDQIKEGTVIKSYYFNNKTSRWNKTIIEIIKEVLSFYNKKFGFFPYKQLSIVPGNNFDKGGYSNSNIIILHDTLDTYKNQQEAENYLRWYIAYYIGQQYFGYYVGQSGENPEWLISGASLYLSSIYLKDKNIKPVIFNELTDSYLGAAKANFDTKILQPVEELEKSDFDWEKILTRGKSAQIFSMLGNILGKKVLLDSLKEVLLRYNYSFITTLSFEAILESISNKKIDWFIDQWVNENKKIDYGISKIRQNKIGNKYRITITLKKIEKAVMPVSIVLTMKSGIKVFQIWEGNVPEADLTYEYSEQVRMVQIDPAENLPDIDRSNNQMNVPGI